MKKKLIAGITVTMFLVTMVTVALPARVSAAFDGTIEIGIVGPKGWIQWDGLWEAATFAADYVNKEEEFSALGGPAGFQGPGGKWYRVVLVDIDEHSVPNPDPAAAISELLMKLEAHPKMFSIYGGFRSECAFPMQDALLDYAAVHKRPVWTIAGAATDELLFPGIKDDYARYKYMFRATPMNSTVLAEQFAALIGQIISPKLAALYYGDATQLVPAYIIAENLVWCDVMVQLFTGAHPTKDLAAVAQLDVKGQRRPSALATDFTSDIAEAVAKGAKIVIHIFSAVAGANFIKQVGALKPPFACIGINVESQAQEFYDSVGGACQYETFLASVGTPTGDPYNLDAKPLDSVEFADKYKARYGHSPIYTAWGAYDAIMAANETSYDPGVGSGWTVLLDVANNYANPNIDAYIEFTETMGASVGFNPTSRPDIRIKLADGCVYRKSSLLGYARQSPDTHDAYASMGCLSPIHDYVARAYIPQWQAGNMEVTYPRDQPFSRKWMIPTWMYSLETDFAGEIEFSTGEDNINYTAPNGKVDPFELAALAETWFSEPHWRLLEADMQPYDHFIDVYDASKVGKDWGKTATPH